MRIRKKALLIGVGTVIAMQGHLAHTVEAKQVTVDSQVLEQLQKLVADQQKQLDSLQNQVHQFQQTATQAQAQAQEAKSVAEEAKTTAEAPAAKTVISGQDRVSLTVSGQIDRAMNVVDDGDNTDAYFVDNNNSNSRLRFIGKAGIDEDLTLGSRFEIAFSPNNSSQVSQNNQETSDFTDIRWADVSLLSKRYGTIFLGKGDTASNDSAEVDLSGTSVIAYTSIADIAGGMLFRDSFDNQLTSIKVSNAFSDFDGLSRKNRLRYDLPTFYGFGLAASVVSDQRWDTALTWSGTGYGFKAGAAAAVAYLNTDASNWQYDGSFSVLHEVTGLNFTFSAGTQDTDFEDDPYNVWGKIGWQTKVFPVGLSSFSVDYGRTENLLYESAEGNSFGIAMVQSFADYGTEIYLQFRQYALDLEAQDLDNINVGTFGARVKF